MTAGYQVDAVTAAYNGAVIKGFVAEHVRVNGFIGSAGRLARLEAEAKAARQRLTVLEEARHIIRATGGEPTVEYWAKWGPAFFAVRHAEKNVIEARRET